LGAGDAFVTKVSPTGTSWVYSTYLGGGGSDIAHGLAVDASGGVTVVGATQSVNLPTTADALQTVPSGPQDGCVTRLNAAGSGLTFSTSLGGPGADAARSVALDSVGSTFVTGVSSTFPTTPGVFRPTAGGGDDAFITRIGRPVPPEFAPECDGF